MDSNQIQRGSGNPLTGEPTITGTAQVGETLTASTTGISEADGMNDAAFAYQWLAAGAEIDGATASAYTLADADEDKAVKVQVSFTDDRGNDEILTSAATEAVQPRPNSPVIRGTARVGETLTADTSEIYDPDGLQDAVFAYQWIAGGADIEGGTGSSYRVAAEDEGLIIQVWVSFTDDAGNQETRTSDGTEPVASQTRPTLRPRALRPSRERPGWVRPSLWTRRAFPTPKVWATPSSPTGGSREGPTSREPPGPATPLPMPTRVWPSRCG